MPESTLYIYLLYGWPGSGWQVAVLRCMPQLPNPPMPGIITIFIILFSSLRYPIFSTLPIGGECMKNHLYITIFPFPNFPHWISVYLSIARPRILFYTCNDSMLCLFNRYLHLPPPHPGTLTISISATIDTVSVYMIRNEYNLSFFQDIHIE